MKNISVNLATMIGTLALSFANEEDFEKYYSAENGGRTIHKDFKNSDLLCSIMICEKGNENKGIHINVMANGDVFARNFPYYDGVLELIPVFNQRKIYDLVESF